MTPRTTARAQLVLAAVLWSTSGVILKSIPSVHWLAIAGVRSLFAALLFLPGIWQPRPPWRKLLPAVILYAVLVSALMGSMQLGTAAQGIWLQYTAPAVVALWYRLVQRERLRPAQVVAVLLTIVAVALILSAGTRSPEDQAAHQRSVWLGVVSGLAFGMFLVLLKSMADTPPSAIFLWTNLGTAVVLLPFMVALEIPVPVAGRELGLLAAMGIGQLALAYHLFQRGLARTHALDAALIVLLEPILNPIWVYLIRGESPAPQVIAGCALIALGLVAFALSPSSQTRAEGEG